MIQQATRRNAAAIAAGRVTLTLGTVEALPPVLDGPFDVILAVNSLGFWPQPAERLEDLRRRLAPGGRIAIASQPCCPGATRVTSLAAAREITDLLQTAGFTQTSTETLDLDPPVVWSWPSTARSRRRERAELGVQRAPSQASDGAQLPP